MSTYVISDLHNCNRAFQDILRQIQLGKEDKLIILGDIFDRGREHPYELWHSILWLGDRVKIVRGNHDHDLMKYILRYYGMAERCRKKIDRYQYDTFEQLQERMVEKDLIYLAEEISKWPLQMVIEVSNKKYLLSHAQTAPEDVQKVPAYYLEGDKDYREFLRNGISGSNISIIGHYPNASKRIERNENGNVIRLDCGAGKFSSVIGCLCLDNMKEFYSKGEE